MVEWAERESTKRKGKLPTGIYALIFFAFDVNSS